MIIKSVPARSETINAPLLVSGHDFSRAEKAAKGVRASAPAKGCASKIAERAWIGGSRGFQPPERGRIYAAFRPGPSPVPPVNQSCRLPQKTGSNPARPASEHRFSHTDKKA